MTDHPEYTLTQPPTCPRKWDDLILMWRPVVTRLRLPVGPRVWTT